MALEIGGDRFQQLAVRWVEHSVGLVERALRLTALLFVDIAHSLTPLANCQIFSLSHFGLKNFALGSNMRRSAAGRHTRMPALFG
jgi:hypothetical protein